MIDEIERVAKGLTKAQRVAILSAILIPATSAYRPEGFYVHTDKRVRRRLACAGVVRDYLGEYQRLTDFGLAVRHYLQEQEQ